MRSRRTTPITSKPDHYDNGNGTTCDSVAFYQHDAVRIDVQHWKYNDGAERLTTAIHTYNGTAAARLVTGSPSTRGDYVLLKLGETPTDLQVVDLYVTVEQATALRDALIDALG